MKFCKSKENKIALAVGLFAAALHAIWALAVAVGVGQMYLDWILPLHFISNLYVVMGFDMLNAVFLVIMAFLGGYVASLLFIWLLKIMKVRK
jgi:hypothetical protein